MIGETISHYRILQKLGGGGMGVVYEAEDSRLGRHVALKFLPDEMGSDADALERFQREARAASALNHPNICTIYDIGDHEGRPFIVMELMRGQTLKQLIDKKPLDPGRAAELAVQLTDALDAAHSEGIIHRDIKPDNIFITDRGQAKLLDFGLAKLTPLGQAAEDSETPTAPIADHLTTPGTTMGTMAYMSPEQIRGDSLDARTDLFSLGVVLYEMSTGTQPFTGKTSAVTLAAILDKEPLAARSVVPNLPAELDGIINKALEKNVERRYRTAKALLTELRALPTTPTSPLRKLGWATAAAIGAVVAIGLAFWAGRGGEAPETSPTVAEESKATVAVLPFVNLSADQENEYFADGLTEELIHALTKVEGLQVSSRTSVFTFKGKSDLELREIGGRLGVENILEGSIRRAGDRLRISAQLIKVADGFPLWSESYDREMKDVFAIQEGIAQNIVQALQVTLSPSEELAIGEAPTANVQAYDYYLRGREFFYRKTLKDTDFAEQMFSEAIGKDPQYALAYAGRADCYSITYDYYGADEKILAHATGDSRRAVALQPQLAEARASLGFALSMTLQFEESERELETAIRLNPKLFEAYYYYARVLFRQGKFEEAARNFEKAAELDPWDFQALQLLPQVYRSLGRASEEAESLRKLGAVAGKHLELNPDDLQALLVTSSALNLLGNTEEGTARIDRVISLAPDDPGILYNAACGYSLGGQIDKSVDTLERAVELGFTDNEWMEQDSDLDAVRDDPRFQALLERMRSQKSQ